MTRKYFVILGLILVSGFLFLNATVVKAETWTWTGAGDTHTWTDPANWGMGALAGPNSYPGATTTADVVIGGGARVIATTTINTTGFVGSLTLGSGAGNNSASILTIAKGATIYASSTVSLISTSTLAFGDTTTNTNAGGVLNLGSGNLTLGGWSGASSTPLTVGALATFSAGTSTVTYAGSSNLYIATTTFYNLTLTPTSTLFFATSTIGNGGNLTVSRALTIGPKALLNMNGRTLILSNSIASPDPDVTSNALVYVSDGSFIANNSTTTYSGTATQNIATGTYAILTISGSPVKSLVGNTTALTKVNVDAGTLAVGAFTFTVSNSFFNIASGATLTIAASGVVTATGATWTNSGTVTETGTGKITLAAAGVISNSAGGSAVTSFGNADSLPRVHIQITDTSLNLLASTIETKTATVTSTSGLTTSQSVTLTETSATSGIFQGSIPFTLSATAVSGSLAYQSSGTVSYTWTDSQDSTDTQTGSASFTGTTPGGGSDSSTVTVAVVTPAVPATPATPAVPAVTPAVPATPATPAIPAAPSLDSVSTKIASVVAKVSALTKLSPAADIAAVQAEIAAILNDIKTIQAASPAPKGVALGFNFVRPLALGMRHTDVSKLQEALKTDSSIYPEGVVSGYFGPATLKAVKKFQEKYGLASPGAAGYGTVGPKTRAKLNELYK